ncbi:hypothetical protein HMPREF3048_05310 [Corynebacterium sp. HMSC075D04]|uniref:hypothetical protein n=1 Tax=Corynebacterium sp. HMSC075D04 TaxID=1739540 RepID=UPI0008A104D6|nr:hypothetical protein [Corynebacterium sp. HMSC075D04]OFO36176.1 hypothetical protein HMPREF3048_05310 [Corynebacterium sp. HMSC075D04]
MNLLDQLIFDVRSVEIISAAGAFSSAAVTGGVLGAVTTEVLGTRKSKRNADSEYELAVFEFGADLRLLDRRLQETEAFSVNSLIIESIGRIEGDLKELYQAILLRRRFSRFRRKWLDQCLSKTQEALVRLSSSLGLQENEPMTYEDLEGLYTCCETYCFLSNANDSGRMGRELSGPIQIFATRIQKDAKQLGIGSIGSR